MRYHNESKGITHEEAVKNLNIRDVCLYHDECLFKISFNNKCYDSHHPLDPDDDEFGYYDLSDPPEQCKVAPECDKSRIEDIGLVWDIKPENMKSCQLISACYVEENNTKKFLPSVDPAILINNSNIRRDEKTAFNNFLPESVFSMLNNGDLDVPVCTIENLKIRGMCVDNDCSSVNYSSK